MSEGKKLLISTLNPMIEPRDLNEVTAKTGNLYKSITVLGKRANQINTKIKDELHRKLEEFGSHTDNLEEMTMDIESNGFYEIYELLDEKIKDNIIQNLQKLFNKKKIKINMDLTDIFDEE